jgi:sulfonate transport system permease protein
MIPRSLIGSAAWNTTAREAPLTRLRPDRLLALLLPAVLPLGLLLAWQLASVRGWLAPQILPAPATVVGTFTDLVRDGELAQAFAISLRRILSGLAIGVTAGFGLGVALGLWPALEDYVGPSLRAIAQVPSLGSLPFLILVFGIGETLNAVLIAKACFVPVVLSTSAAIRTIEPRYIEVARVFRLRRSSFLFRLILPAASPSVFSGVRLALGQAWVSLVVVEMLADTEGLGYLMTWGRTIFQLDIVLVGMIVIGVIGFILDTGLRRIERRLQRWAPDRG